MSRSSAAQRRKSSIVAEAEILRFAQPDPVTGIKPHALSVLTTRYDSHIWFRWEGDLFGPAGGGGYLNECNRSEVSKRDLEVAKIRELEDMGLPVIWLRVARAIGFENFMQFWRIVDTAAEHREMRLSDNESMIEVQMRRYASFRRYQRNRFIETLAASGHSATEIQQAVKGQLGESLSRNHIVRLARRGRMPR